MMFMAKIARRTGNELYKVAFPLYRPLYGAFKALSDRDERRFLRRYISAGSVVVDAGANIGIYSQFLAECVGPDGHVHSFEPAPKNFARLRAAVSSLSNVHANQFAVSDKTGNATLYVSDNLNVDHRAYATQGEPRRSISIRSIRLDDYFRPGERVDLIKMDIQGYELHALQGAARILEDNSRIKLLLEFWPFGLKQAGGCAEGFVSFLHDHGFSIFLPRKSGLLRCDAPPTYPSDANSYLNLFAKRAGEKQIL
jgi:FkbM family methyltransferase